MDIFDRFRNALGDQNQLIKDITPEVFRAAIESCGLTICDSQPVAWTTGPNVESANLEDVSVIGVSARRGSVVKQGNAWANADTALFLKRSTASR
jgi:hypothetical protein